MPYYTYTFLLILILLPILLGAVDTPDQEYLNDFMRVRGDASGADVVYHWTGTVYSYIPGQRRVELFKFEGFNVARTEVQENGFYLLTREAAFFQHPQSGEILENWRNPFTGKTIPVLQIWNDPVNQNITFEANMMPYIRKMLPSTDLGSQLVFNQEIFPFYDNPMSRKEYGDYVQSDIYQSAEFFQFFVDKSELADRSLTSVPATISWTRISPWMPFMQMGDREGNLVFVCRGRKLPGGYADLPLNIRDYVQSRHPEYASAPTEFLEPNETSWTYFKKMLDSGDYPPKAKEEK